MSLTRSFPRAAAVAGISLIIGFSGSAEAQRVTVNRADETSEGRIVRRQDEKGMLSSIRTRHDDAMLLLSSDELILQLTDSALARVASKDSAGTNLFFRMIRASVAALLDNAIAIRLDEIRHARADGTRIVFVNVDGEEVLENVEVNGRQVTEDFHPKDAERFAAAVNQAIAKRPR